MRSLPRRSRVGCALDTWLAGPSAIERFRRRTLGQRTVVLPPRDPGWRRIAPDFDAVLDLARAGVPFQTVAARRYDRRADPSVLRRAVREGRTIFFPQIHQVLPRLARLMVAIRVLLVGPAREEASYLFAVEGQGRDGMGLHHDGAVNAFWLQLEGRRTVTIGPPVSARAPLDLPDTLVARDRRMWRTIDLTPGTLFHMPPRTPHRVVCHGRSLAVSMTWTCARPRARNLEALVAWDVVDGTVDAIPRPSRDRLWVQVPIAPGPVDPHGTVTLSTADGGAARLPAAFRAWATKLTAMPTLERGSVPADALRPLSSAGIVAPVDLPLVVRPARPRALDGWRFA